MFKNLYTTRMSGDGKLLQRRFTAIRQGGSFSRIMTTAAITAVLVVMIVTAAFAATLNYAQDYDSSFDPINREDMASGVNIADSDESYKSMDPLGITLTATNVTDTGLTIICEQSGGSPTGELQTGSAYTIERRNNDGTWTPAEAKKDIIWYLLAYRIAENDKTTWDVNWENLYGHLPEGSYRIGKSIDDFRQSGDYDTRVYYAEFDINKTSANKKVENIQPVVDRAHTVQDVEIEG